MQTVWFDQQIARVNAVNTCAELAEVSTEVRAKAATLLSDINAQIAAISPLLVVPTSLTSVISWITASIQTYVVPHAALLVDAATVAEKTAALADAIANKASSLGCS